MRAAAAAAVLASATGCMGWCDLDPFGLTERPIVGGYRLKAWEDDSTYYLLTPGDTGAALQGTPVERLGWDPRHVVVLRAGDGAKPDGWAVIDVATGRTRYVPRVPGLAADSVGARVPTFAAREAWARLGSRRPGV